MADDTKPVLDEVFAERLRQEELRKSGKFLWTCADPDQSPERKLAVLAEEFGEAAREVTEIVILNSKRSAAKLGGEEYKAKLEELNRRLRKELIQVAAVATAWAEGMPRG
jgi:NTP pyrophosphatase (non-canonical NTP hydrolase)